jgi:hypothetical protein
MHASIKQNGQSISADSHVEQGGWAEYVVPEVPPKGTPGEWIEDPYNEFGDVPVGPGKFQS